jgi:hypothetical protein
MRHSGREYGHVLEVRLGDRLRARSGAVLTVTRVWRFFGVGLSGRLTVRHTSISDREQRHMSFVQSSVASERRGPFGAEPTRPPLDLRPVLGLGLVGLGVGMLCLGVFHGFEHGSCSTTGYSRN